MGLYMRIMAIVVLGVITANCGNNNSDGRIVLSSQSEEDQLVIPVGDCEDCVVSKSEVEKAIADSVGDISKVSDLSFDQSLAQFFTFNSFVFNVSFTIKTNLGNTYANIQCKALTKGSRIRLFLQLEHCSNELVKLYKSLSISLEDKLFVT